ncbi:MAG: RHS repeat-associated core domain-containing protein, partial [Gemmatimonadales bacterium]
FFHAPGLDDPVLMIYRGTSSFVYRELYLMTDGAGRQLAVGDSIGYIDIDDLQTTGRTEWRYAGQTSNAQGFGAERYQAPSIAGVSYFRNRAYDTRTGRWTQEDPVGLAGGVNLYQYAGNDPVGFTDPFGLKVTVDKALQDLVSKLRGGSETFDRIFTGLDKKPALLANLFVQACSTDCPQSTVDNSGGGHFQAALVRQDIWVDDVKYAGEELVVRLAHEMVEAGVGIDPKATGTVCNKGESEGDCVVRYENEIRKELHIEPRDLKKDPHH